MYLFDTVKEKLRFTNVEVKVQYTNDGGVFMGLLIENREYELYRVTLEQAAGIAYMRSSENALDLAAQAFIDDIRSTASSIYQEREELGEELSDFDSCQCVQLFGFSYPELIEHRWELI